ncbi:MAG TPA: hypothetical protein DEP46_00660, partial [Blastocatellia bacterium]|nr:hypothetical protein [Blastocatellia bacterium]
MPFGSDSPPTPSIDRPDALSSKGRPVLYLQGDRLNYHEAPMSIADLEEKIGHRFADNALLSRALTHSSVATEREAGRETRTTSDDYETLEFLGDA